MGNNNKNRPAGSMGRRDLLKAMTALPAAALIPLPAQGAEKAPAAAQAAGQAAEAAKGYTRKILTEHEYQTVSVLSDLIIPADERSGSATQAGVPEFIDDWLDFKGGTELDIIRGGLIWLDIECHRLYGHDLVDCAAEQKKQILDRIAYPKTAALNDANAVAFFNRMRDLVLSGFFSSEMGVKDLPYLGNQMLSEWPGCPPEVMAKIEENEKKLGQKG